MQSIFCSILCQEPSLAAHLSGLSCVAQIEFARAPILFS